MPNWCENYMQVVGEPAKIAELLDGFDNEGEHVEFLAKHAPLSCGDWDYGTAIDEWGTKWDLANFHYDYKAGDDNATVRFESAWAPPVEGIRRVSQKFPLLAFGLSWMENGMCFYGYAGFHRGHTVGLFDGDIPDFYEQAAAKLGKDEDDPEVCDLAVDMEHDLWSRIDDLATEQMKLAQVYGYHNNLVIPKGD